MNRVGTIDVFLRDYPALGEMASEFEECLFDYCRTIVPNAYSDKAIRTGLVGYFMQMIVEPYLIEDNCCFESIPSRLQMLTEQERQQMENEIRDDLDFYADHFQEYETPGTADACMLLFGDESYERLGELWSEVRTLYVAIAQGEESIRDQQFYDDKCSLIEQYYPTLTEYGIKCGGTMFAETLLYLEEICPDVTVNQHVYELILGEQYEASK